MDYRRICELIGYLYDVSFDESEVGSDKERELMGQIESAIQLAHEIQREKRPENEKPLDCT